MPQELSKSRKDGPARRRSACILKSGREEKSRERNNSEHSFLRDPGLFSRKSRRMLARALAFPGTYNFTLSNFAPGLFVTVCRRACTAKQYLRVERALARGRRARNSRKPDRTNKQTALAISENLKRPTPAVVIGIFRKFKTRLPPLGFREAS